MQVRKRLRAKKPTAKRTTKPAGVGHVVQDAINSKHLGVRAMLIAGIGIMGAALLVAARQPSPDEASVRVSRAGSDKTLSAEIAVADAPLAEPAVTTVSPKPEQVTVTGCLEQSNDTFRLKNTSGDDAPKTRSWKSGFLKKRPAPIGIVDSGRRLKLPAHVGERVSVTGVMMNREMQARTLQKVGATCS